jgi:hypothetical protein
MPRFIRELMEFVKLGDADLAAIRRTAPIVLRHETALTAAVYEHLLEFPATARFFVRADGTPDLDRLERRQHSLGRWLRETAALALTHGFAYYLLSVGLAHSHRDARQGGGIPPHFMVGSISVIQSALARVFRVEIEDPHAALEASTAWNKLLLVQLNVLLLGYLRPT